jgi:two-component system chemotaxis sensor kinase CheA
MKTSDYKELFKSEADEILQGLEEGVMNLERGSDREPVIEELFRHAHNLKGMSGAMGYDLVVEASHALENILDGCRRGTLDIDSAGTDVLLKVVDLLGALVRWTIEEEAGPGGNELLGEILALLDPMAGGNDGRCRGDQAGEDGGSAAEPESKETPAEEAGCAGTPAGMNSGIKSTKVDLERLDKLMDLVGELIISRIRLGSLAAEAGSRRLSEELTSSGRLISEIQKEVMEARLVPAGQVFHRFKRLAREAARELGKNVDFRIEGSEIGLDRTVLESMVDPLVHLIRNAIDHGVESPEERACSGKNETASVVLSARRERNRVILEVSDDGKGLDFEKIRQNISSSGQAVDRNAELTEEELCRILTAPGFSTRENVSRYSGRGIGMNVVMKVIDSLGGSLHVKSVPGSGTSISMHRPINLSIIKALLFHAGGNIHALPIECIKETARVEEGSFRTIRGRDVMETINGPVPVIRPGEIFGLDQEKAEIRFIKVILADTGEGDVCLVVNRILGQQDVVVKSLPNMIRGISGISGATILGSGKIAFIWDPRVLFHGRSTHESDKETVVSQN